MVSDDPTATAAPLAVNGQAPRFVDSDGLPRYASVFGFNAFGRAKDAAESVQRTLRGGREFYVWRLADGLYDWTATADPHIPGHPAERVTSW